jgi:hypothetical protein
LAEREVIRLINAARQGHRIGAGGSVYRTSAAISDGRIERRKIRNTNVKRYGDCRCGRVFNQERSAELLRNNPSLQAHYREV